MSDDFDDLIAVSDEAAASPRSSREGTSVEGITAAERKPLSKRLFPLWLQRALGILVFLLISDGCSLLLSDFGIFLPGAVAGLTILVIVLFTIPIHHIATFLNPACELLLKWIAVLYVPVMTAVPLSLKRIEPIDYPKLIAIQVTGVMFVATTSGRLLIWIRRLHDRFFPRPSSADPTDHDPGDTRTTATGPKKLLLSPVPLGLMLLLLVLLLVLFSAGTPMRSTVFFLLSLISASLFFNFGQWLEIACPRVPWPHPMLTSAAISIVMFSVIGTAKGESLDGLLQEYLTRGHINIFRGLEGAIGPGNVYLYFLDAAIVSMALLIFSQKKAVLFCGTEMISVSFVLAFLSIFATVGFARLLQLQPFLIRSTALRTITTPIALASVRFLDGDAGLTGVLTLTTGILGAAIWRPLLRWNQYKDPLTRGFVMGAVATGLGSAICLSEEPPAAPFSAVSFVVVAVASSLWIAIPIIREMIFQIAG